MATQDHAPGDEAWNPRLGSGVVERAVLDVEAASPQFDPIDLAKAMAITIDDQRRQKIAKQLQAFFREHYDEDLSDFRTTQIMDFFLSKLGPEVYNQAVQDARRFMLQKLEDLDGEVYQPEGT